MKHKIKKFLLLNLGVLLVAAGVYFFKFPNHFSTGGVSGIAVLMSALPIPLSSATIMAILNVLFLILGFLFLGGGFGAKTVYCSLALSVFTQAFEMLIPMSEPFTNQPMLELIFSVILPGIGSAILFTSGASSGGTDIIAMIIRKFTSVNIGIALMVSDFFITFATLFIFGIEVCLYSMLGLVIKSFVLDIVIENISTKKVAFVITSERKKIETYITGTLNRGVTKWDCVGVYTGSSRTALMTALSRTQAIALREYAQEIDPTAFIVINSSTEIIGKGFRRGY